MYCLHNVRMQISFANSVCSVMMVTAQCHNVLNNIFALASAVYVMEIDSLLATHLTGDKTINAIAEVFKVDGAVLCHSLDKKRWYSSSIAAIILSASGFA